ncbi:bifunctional diaminohydroxyphosphoribosylaminopyrimidine deaminase/5-amino-6-(5-phosphoribosylamino)uracil reductase RibD [Shewanella sp. SNU WT4]|uniref:bifunctional diaminohydroxyphosphoribosylaminopyrimidine deaminase/5-amino-6-(5-phosphoribosylamino)uracil reductase RibD n=1 Tax=Shewanella sp. SNU WT4 TaxID=2590015 RepID=UPI00112B6707|nr:bifunctional diaminohydroxyphosphoribosylaminopyrimidine deaminase/5-amino-6-(5-phosphoribosylamino)uracil reductase RibD [Shewanella sp. SNU WT4]QDF68467.1 bifunctional diaminohydroxyphosphoribosylaminopyrimidine deaminase/5-amino-6-(5-phosphoribosylamino)uracil reductase RibD [Shewanella sp. SNU WT4]
MNRALLLAAKGRYTTAPNPNVGCVISLQGQIVGEGYHQRAGGPHAEVFALREAQGKTQGATAYVTLEPCSHYGRTPPCALALIEAGVTRVVIAMVDPNPQVAGKGVALLEQAGIKVDIGLGSEASRQLNLGFLHRMETGLARVSIKLAASLDGKTALRNGVSKWITGPESRRDVQRMRARHGALITGIETVLADDPTLTVRHQELGELSKHLAAEDVIQPVRVVLDSQARLPASARLFSAPSPIILVSVADYADSTKQNWPAHVSHWRCHGDDDGRINLRLLIEKLSVQHHSIMIEAGATLAGAFIDQGLVDELVLYQAIKILGSQGRNLVNLSDYSCLDDTPRCQLLDERAIGADRRLTLGFLLKSAHTGE